MREHPLNGSQVTIVHAFESPVIKKCRGEKNQKREKGRESKKRGKREIRTR